MDSSSRPLPGSLRGEACGNTTDLSLLGAEDLAVPKLEQHVAWVNAPTL
jgi:hypothetical protein